MTKKTYHGSCHCGAVRFECDIDLAEGTSKCNCSMCTKGRFWKAVVKPDAFRLLKGRDALTDYRFGNDAIQHLFCRRCGIKPFGHGMVEGVGEFYGINLACLDDVSPAELVEAPMRYEDGRNDRWESPPAETRHL
jgi:hypothetical protein